MKHEPIAEPVEVAVVVLLMVKIYLIEMITSGYYIFNTINPMNINFSPYGLFL